MVILVDNKSMAWGSQQFNLSGMSSPVEIVNQVFAQAVAAGASDILFEPMEKEVAARLRVDGVLQPLGVMPYGAYDQVLSRLKVLGNMDVAENRKPQESKIRVDLDGHAYVLRVAVVSTNFGQMAALRLLDLPQYDDFESLGMTKKMGEEVKKNISGRYGLFLVCGPTGAGKTTTVHACLKYLNNGEVNIMTIEDPIEYVMSGINQIEVGEDVGLDFVKGLRVMLRLNPDVVFVGEIRDAETAKIAIQASLTGHLVISTIHSRSSVGAIYRLMDLGIDSHLINYALRAVVAQRLMRKICEHCRQPYTPSPEELAMYQADRGTNSAQSFAGTGCEMCHNSKYRGRAGVYEFLQMDEDIRKMVLDQVGEEKFKDELNKKGFGSMTTEGLALVDQGITSISEYIRTMYDAK